MDLQALRELLERVHAGRTSVDAALAALRELPFRDVGTASVDHHRALRQGIPEVIFGERKSVDQIATIAHEIVKAGQNVLVPRLDADEAAGLSAVLPAFEYVAAARVGKVRVASAPKRDAGPVAVLNGGTSDVPVAEEACETLAAATRVYDVGVAGLHRLLARAPVLTSAAAVIVVAGMESALPSFVGGLIAAPVVAVPTSVGYGAALGGLTALFSMLTSCASGVVVVNIDSGFGAAMAVDRMLSPHGESAARR